MSEAPLNDSNSLYPLQLSSFVDIKIVIVDLDDNEPEFSESIMKRNISDNSLVGASFGFIPLAHDRDTFLENTRIRYTIKAGNLENKFSVNEHTGELILMDELEKTLTAEYELTISATSRNQTIPPVNETTNPLGFVKIRLSVVSDELFIQFQEPSYYVSVAKFLNSQSGGVLRQFKLNELKNIEPNQKVALGEAYLRQLQTAAIFFSRAHIIQYKPKRHVRFSIDMVQLTRNNERNSRKLPLDWTNSTDDTGRRPHSLLSNAVDLKLDPERTNLFDIDAYTGKVFINREVLDDLDYSFGDLFILSIVATAYAPHSDSVLNPLENTMTRLYVRITQKDYSLIMPIKDNLGSILLNNLNPLKEMYMPRLLVTDGVKITIQDLVMANQTELSGLSIGETNNFDIIMQVETNFDHRPIGLDKFVNMWQNFSASTIYFKDFDRVGALSDSLQNNETAQKPFYFSWIFWFALISVLFAAILIAFCVNCFLMNKAMAKNK